jgi:hypothetical protein
MHNQVYSNDSCKAKDLKWGGMHWCLPLLKNGTMLDFLCFMNVDPQSSTWLDASCSMSQINLSHNVSHNLNN